MSKTAREVILKDLFNYSVDVPTDDVAESIIAALDAGGFVIVPKATLDVYANPAHWRMLRQSMGHGEGTANVLTWCGPDADLGYSGPTKGPEYAAEALTAASPQDRNR